MKILEYKDLTQDWKDIFDAEERIALDAFKNYTAKQNKITSCIMQIKEIFKLEKEIRIINGFDNSHFQTKHNSGVCIFWQNGEFEKDEYRKYNFKNSTAGDDHGMMVEMISRRLTEIKTKNIQVDLLIIDGGKIQMSAAEKAIAKCSVRIPFICIKKGEKRDWKNDTFLHQDITIEMKEDCDGLKLLQSIRDEAHRFAGITSAKKLMKDVNL